MTRGCLVACLALACGSRHDHSHDEQRHELPGQSVTLWTEQHELFMEYAPLIVGRESGFAAHVTMLPGFKAATAGAVTVALGQAGGAALESRADAPKSPGIFRPALTPTASGACTMTVTIERDGGRDVLPVEGCVVYADEKAARGALGEEAEPAGRITYLKEQAWKTDFANAPVGERELQPSVGANGEIKPLAGKEARMTAPSTGRVVLAEPGPVLGMAVRKGQLLASLAPRLEAAGDRAGIEAEAQAARAELAAAQAQLARAERLFAEQAIPEKQLEEARTRLSVARARASGAQGRVAQVAASASGRGGAGRSALQLRSPIDGTLVTVSVTTGQTVEEGDPMFVVIDLTRVWLEARVFEPDIPKVETARTAWFTIDGYDEPFGVDEANGRLVTVGRLIDPATRTVPVIFELANPEGRLRIGQFAKVWIATGAPVRALAIPETAIIEEAGKAIAYVQVEGEAFERRALTVGVRSRGWVEVKEGLAAGERVVVKGAYEIKLASAAGSIPAHGHAH
jgi:RND family efflux transporter MFP subunit